MAQKKKMRIVIADDEAHIRKLITAFMKSMNAVVVGEAENGNQAVELYRKEKPNLMLLDVNMPQKTGELVLKEIRAEFPDAFVIMLTGVSDMDTVQKCLELGAANFIRKDTPIPEMKDIIKDTWRMFKKGKGS